MKLSRSFTPHTPHSLSSVLFAAVCCAGILALSAAAGKPVATPKGGRLLEKTSPKAELVVEKDHTVTIHFYDDALKPIAATSQNVTLTADATGGKTRIEFEKKGDSLVGKTPLPSGDGYNVVVQFKQDAQAKSQNFRFKLDLSVCGGCQRAEYGCICDH